MKVNLSEKSIQTPTSYDINPLIYYRINKPLKAGVKLPMINLKDFYNESAAYGLDFTVEPDVQFTQNDMLLDLTKTEFAEIVELINKFIPELD